jgi:hypothetical protein
MGYTLTIGEAILEYNEDFVTVGADHATHPDAPQHCPFTKDGNSRSPGYSAWSNFCKSADITPLFYGGGWQYPGYAPCPDDFHRETCLLNEHPGAMPISTADADYVSAKLAAYQEKNPDAEPGFWDFGEHTGWREVDNGKDPTLARLVWLDFWMRWAVEKCSRPVFANY